MGGIQNDALTEPSSALIVGELTSEEKRKVQGLVIDNMRARDGLTPVEDAKDLLIALGPFFYVDNKEQA